MKRIIIIIAGILLLTSSTLVGVAWATAPSGLHSTMLGRISLGPYRDASPNFTIVSKHPTDTVVLRTTIDPGGSTGWHQHPGPIFITVTKGQLTYYEADDPTCTPHVVTAGHGFVDTGDGHFVRNETSQPAQDISVITAPVGGAFRTELPAPNPNCGF